MSPRFTLTGPFGLSLAALMLVVLFLLFTLPSLVGAVFTAGTGKSKPADTVTKLMTRHDETLKTYQDRFNGRSAFFKPPPIYVAPPPKPPDQGPPPPPPPPPPPTVPAVYGGPSLTAIFGDEAWFKAPTNGDKPFTLRVGETESKSGVKLLSTDAPWTIRVAHKGGEYTVGFNTPMFDPSKSDSHFKSSPKLNLPIPGLNIMPIPMPAAEVASSEPDAPKVADEDPDEDEPAVPPSTSPGRLQAQPLDGRDRQPRETEKTREENGESEDEDEDAKPAQSQPDHVKPPVTPTSPRAQDSPDRPRTTHQDSPAGPK